MDPTVVMAQWLGLEQSVYGNEREAGEASKKQASRRRSSVGAGIRNSYIKLLLFVAVSHLEHLECSL